MKLEYFVEGDVGICSISGRLDASNASSLKSEFQKGLNENVNVVMNLDDMDYIDSTGLGALVACLKYATEAGGNIKIANLQAKPRMVFEITRAYKIFDIYDSTKEAVASY